MSALASQGVNLLALTAVHLGASSTQLTLFPDDSGVLLRTAKLAGMTLQGPMQALMVTGDDELGALASIHAKLSEANVSVYASSAVTDGRGSYGYIIHVRPEEQERAARALEL